MILVGFCFPIFWILLGVAVACYSATVSVQWIRNTILRMKHWEQEVMVMVKLFTTGQTTTITSLYQEQSIYPSGWTMKQGWAGSNTISDSGTAWGDLECEVSTHHIFGWLFAFATDSSHLMRSKRMCESTWVDKDASTCFITFGFCFDCN